MTYGDYMTEEYDSKWVYTKTKESLDENCVYDTLEEFGVNYLSADIERSIVQTTSRVTVDADETLGAAMESMVDDLSAVYRSVCNKMPEGHKDMALKFVIDLIEKKNERGDEPSYILSEINDIASDFDDFHKIENKHIKSAFDIVKETITTDLDEPYKSPTINAITESFKHLKHIPQNMHQRSKDDVKDLILEGMVGDYQSNPGPVSLLHSYSIVTNSMKGENLKDAMDALKALTRANAHITYSDGAVDTVERAGEIVADYMAVRIKKRVIEGD